ncbi:MAG: LysR family transcriptional regulator [Brevundimonas sp.]
MISVYDLNWRHLLAVAQIGRSGALVAAAEAVHLSQPALTQALLRLEQGLSTQLFHRSPRGMTPTQAGELFIARIDRAAAALSAGVAQTRRAARPPAEILVRRLSMSQLRAMGAVADAGGFAEAARKLGLSQPSIHRAVRDLEVLLDVPLLQRLGRGVALTPSAQIFVRHAGLARAELASGLEEVAALKPQGRGRIVVGAMPLARSGLLPRTLSIFCRDHPSTTVRVVEGAYEDLLAGLLAGDIDVLVGAARNPLPSDAILQSRLFEDRLAIFGRPHHPLAGPAPISPQDLALFPWVIAPRDTPLREQWERLFIGLEPPISLVECSAVDTTRGLLLDGDWLTLLYPDQLRIEETAGVLVRIGEDGYGAARQIVATIRKDWSPTAQQAAFLVALTTTATDRS